MGARSEDLKTPLARFSFPNLLKPQTKKKDNGTETQEYNCVLLFPKSTDLSVLKNAVAKVAREEWGDKADGWIKDGLIKHPFLDGDGPQGLSKKTGERHAGYEGTTFIRTSSTRRPKLVNRKIEPITDEEEIYAGCYGYAVVNAYAWTNDKGGKGISFGINMLQVAKEGERLGGGGGGDPSQHFEAIPDDGEADKPSSGGKAQQAADLFG